MPQYLAFDYLSDVMCRKQANLSRMLVTCPPHILKSKDTFICDHFSYRKPWSKGIPVIDSDVFLSEIRKEISLLQPKSFNSKTFLQFDGVQYHCTFEKFEEIVPSSDPNSDSEVYDETTSVNLFSLKISKSLDSMKTRVESFTPIAVDECTSKNCKYEDFMINLCQNSHCCKLVEPLLSFYPKNNSLPKLQLLLSKLKVMNISDPTIEVESVIRALLYEDKFPSFATLAGFEKNCCNLSPCTSEIDNFSIDQVTLQEYELSQDIMNANTFILKEILGTIDGHDLVLEQPDSSSKYEDLCSSDQLCMVDIQEEIQRCFCFNSCGSFSNLCDLEKMSCGCNLLPSSIQLLVDETCNFSLSNDKTNAFELPLAPKVTNVVETTNGAAINFLNIHKEVLPGSSGFNSCIRNELQLEHLFKLEEIPNVSRKNSLTRFFIAEPKSMKLWANETGRKNYVEEAFSMNSLQPESHLDGLDLSLPWDPVAHFIDDMAFVRRALQLETFNKNAFHQFQTVDAVSRSEEFDTAQLNESIEKRVLVDSLQEDKENVFNVCEDIPSIKLKENKNFISTAFSKPLESKCAEITFEDKNVETMRPSSLNVKDLGITFPSASDRVQESVRKKTEICDPLADFMVLIGKQKQDDLPWMPSTDVACSSKIDLSSSSKPVRSNNEGLAVKRVRSANQDSPSLPISRFEESSVSCPSKKAKPSLSKKLGPASLVTCGEVASKDKLSKNIQVCITGKSLDIICTIEREANRVLEELRDKGFLPSNGNLTNISREDSRFMIKQQQKILLDRQANGEPVNQMNFYLVQVFHQIVSVFYLLVHVSFTSGLALLHTSMQQLQQDETMNAIPDFQEYAVFFKNSIQNLRFFICNSIGDDSKLQSLLVHPKIVELRAYLLRWFEKQRMKDTSPAKVLIICCTCCRYLFSKLCRELNKVSDSNIKLRAISAATDAVGLTKSDIYQIFERTDVLVIAEQMIFEDFPWSVINLIVDYEHRSDSPWKTLCLKNKIKHVSIESILPSALIDLEEYPHVGCLRKFDSQHTDKLGEESEAHAQPFVIIGSTKVTALGNLLHLLETRYDMLVTERDYSVFGEAAHSQPDVIIDGNTCILLEDIKELQAEGGDRVKALLAVVMSIRVKFSSCYIILTSNLDDGFSDHGFPFNKEAPLNFARLTASVKQLSNCRKDFKVQVICSFNTEELASWIVKLVSQVRSTNQRNKAWNARDRSFLSNDMSKEEKFLLHFHCINSYVAQSLLSVATLKEICQMDCDQIVVHANAERISHNIAENIVESLHTNFENMRQQFSFGDSPTQSTEDVAYPYNCNEPEYYTTGRARSPQISNENQCKEPSIDFHCMPHSQRQYKQACQSLDKSNDRYAQMLPINSKVDVPTWQEITTSRRSSFDEARTACNVKMEPTFPESTTSFRRDNNIPREVFFADISPPNFEQAYTKNDCGGFPAQHFDLQFNHNDHSPSDVHDLMVSARNKLTKFVHENPGRAAGASDLQCRSQASGLYDNTFFVGSDIQAKPKYTSAPYASTVQVHEEANYRQYEPNCIPGHHPFQFMGSSLPEPASEADAFRHHQNFPYSRFSHSKFNDLQNHVTTVSPSWSNYHPLHDIRLSRFEEFSKTMPPPSMDSAFGYPAGMENEDIRVTGTSGSVNIGVAQPFLQQPWLEQVFQKESQRRPSAVLMTPNQRRKMLTFERVPGTKGGQTRLTFY